MQLIEMKLSGSVIVDQALARSGLRLISAQRASYRNRFTPSSPPSSPAPPSAPPPSSSPSSTSPSSTSPARAPTLAVPSAHCAPESVFLRALIAAAKYTNDSALRNARWARYSGGVFGELGVAEADLLGLARREEVVVAAGYPSVESTSTLTSIEENVDHPVLRPLQRHRHRSSAGPVPELLPPSYTSASPESSAGTVSPPAPPPLVFTVEVLDVAEHPRPLTNSKRRGRSRLFALLHGHWHFFHHGHRTGAGHQHAHVHVVV
ncbi:hypothetical protein B0H14DRAFT_3855529 [Mycena olivaceomarginata]|nr:hypothetical protein B0H14DRAFT_3855529 [Mycena olivaceomarginata]